MVERVFPGKSSQEVGEIIDNIRLNMTVEPVVTDLSQIGGQEETGWTEHPVPGFNVNYTAPNAREAQQICNELTIAAGGRESQVDAGGGQRAPATC